MLVNKKNQKSSVNSEKHLKSSSEWLWIGWDIEKCLDRLDRVLVIIPGSTPAFTQALDLTQALSMIMEGFSTWNSLLTGNFLDPISDFLDSSQATF